MYTTSYHNTDISKVKILVTGGAGFIGSNLVEYLLNFGVGKLRVLDNFSNGSRKNLLEFEGRPELEIIEGDIRDYDTCINACEGMDIVSHQAALGSVPRSINDPFTTNAVNISGFLNIIMAANKCGIRRVVYAASSSTYGDSKELPKREDKIGKPLSPYAVTKLVNELYAQVCSNIYGIETIGLRYFNVFGPKQNPKGPYAAVIPIFIDQIMKGEAPKIYGDGNQTRDFTFIENAVQANIKALFTENTEAVNQVYNVAAAGQTSLNELVDFISVMAGHKIIPNYLPERFGDIKDSLADITKAKNLLGYNPQYDIHAGLEVAYNWYKQNPSYHVNEQ